MKKMIRFIFLAVLATGCRGTVSDMGLDISESLISCGMEGGKFEIVINGRQDWTTDNTAEWISIRKAGNAASIMISRNGGAAREAVIGFRIGGEIKDEILITQENSDAFSIDKNQAFISYKGGEVAVWLTCFDSWTAYADSDWITLSETEGDSPSEIIIKADRSEDKDGREGKVVFKCRGKVLEMTVMQAVAPFVEVEKTAIAFDGDGGQDQVLYMSNTEVEISCGQDWIRLIKTDGNVRKVSFEVKRNLEKSEREGFIRIASADDCEIFRTISVTQGPKIDHPKLSIAEGDYLELSGKEPVTLHPVFEDMSDHTVAWRSDRPDIADVDRNGVVTIRSGGICTITARNTFHGVEASVTLNIRPKADGMTVMFGAQKMNENPVAVRFKGEKIEISVTMSPADAYCGDITYFSSDGSIAEIVGNTIHCLNPGKTEIYIESLYQSLRQVYTLTVLE